MLALEARRLLALGAVGILIGTTYKAAPAAEAPARAYPGAITGPSAVDDRGLDSPLHKGSIPGSNANDRGLDSPLHKGSIPQTTSDRGLDSPLH